MTTKKKHETTYTPELHVESRYLAQIDTVIVKARINQSLRDWLNLFMCSEEDGLVLTSTCFAMLRLPADAADVDPSQVRDWDEEEDENIATVLWLTAKRHKIRIPIVQFIGNIESRFQTFFNQLFISRDISTILWTATEVGDVDKLAMQYENFINRTKEIYELMNSRHVVSFIVSNDAKGDNNG